MSLRTIGNPVDWKSNNYGIKETTSIHTGKKDTDMERAGLTHMCGGQKLRMDTSRARSPSPTADLPAQGSSARKISPHNFWV